jgi:hypothetical protein
MPSRGDRDLARYSNHVLPTITQNDFAKKPAIQQIKYIYMTLKLQSKHKKMNISKNEKITLISLKYSTF